MSEKFVELEKLQAGRLGLSRRDGPVGPETKGISLQSARLAEEIVDIYLAADLRPSDVPAPINAALQPVLTQLRGIPGRRDDPHRKTLMAAAVLARAADNAGRAVARRTRVSEHLRHVAGDLALVSQLPTLIGAVLGMTDVPRLTRSPTSQLSRWAQLIEREFAQPDVFEPQSPRLTFEVSEGLAMILRHKQLGAAMSLDLAVDLMETSPEILGLARLAFLRTISDAGVDAMDEFTSTSLDGQLATVRFALSDIEASAQVVELLTPPGPIGSVPPMPS